MIFKRSRYCGYFIFLAWVLVVIAGAYVLRWQLFVPAVLCGCQTFEAGAIDDLEAEAGAEVSILETNATGRKTYKIWIAPGSTLPGIAETELRKRVQSAFAELAGFTNADFVLVSSPSGSYARIYTLTKAQMQQKWRDPLGLGRVPLALQSGNRIYLSQAPRWAGARVLEATIIHEFGHRIALRYSNPGDTKHSPANTDIMNVNLPVTQPSGPDKIQFQNKLGKPLSMRFQPSTLLAV